MADSASHRFSSARLHDFNESNSSGGGPLAMSMTMRPDLVFDTLCSNSRPPLNLHRAARKPFPASHSTKKLARIGVGCGLPSFPKETPSTRDQKPNEMCAIANDSVSSLVFVDVMVGSWVFR